MPTSGGSSVGIVRSRIKATEFVCLFVVTTVDFFKNGSLQLVKVKKQILNKATDTKQTNSVV
jgi:hypothetical protein